MEDKKIGVIPSASSYMTAKRKINPSNEALEIANITEKLGLIKLLVPLNESEYSDFLDGIISGLEEIRTFFNQGVNISDNQKLKKSYESFKQTALLKIEAYDSEEVQKLLSETNSKDKSFILDFDVSKGENLGEKLLANTLSVFEAYMKKFEEIAALRAVVSKGA